MRKHVAAVFATLLVSLICSYCTKEPDPIAVTNVTLDSTSIELTEGDSFTLVATISPSNADNKGVIWSTSDASVARVSNNGAVSAISAGQATITATSDDGGKTAKCTVKVNARYIPVKGISLNESSLNLKAGEKSSLTATVSPNDATDKTVTWTSSDRNVVSVDAQGTVTAVSKGDATITAKTNDGGFTALCKVNVTIPVSGISLDKSSMTLEKGESSSLTATVTPADASNNGVTWITSDSSVVTVSEGTVTATGPGNATITAKTADGEKTATCNVTVIVSVKGITLDREELFLEPGSKATLQATISPEDATDKTIVWSSSDPNLISVSNGTVTAIGAGSAIITVATPDGLVKAVCKVASFVDVTGVSLDRNSITVEEGDGIELVATIQPSNATTKDLTWTTNKSSVATVDQSGYVRAVSPGKAVITVKTANGGFTSKCEVTVEKSKPKATSISLDPATALISYSKTSTFTASYYPKDATCDLVWTVSDSGSIEVQGNGNTAQIKAKTSYFGSKELRVTDKRSGLSASAKLYTLIQNFDWTDTPDKLISGDKMIYMALGSTRKIKYTSDAGSDVANIFDMSNNWVCYELSSGVYTPVASPTCISVTTDGVVTALKVGTTGMKPTGFVQAGGKRLYIRVVSSMNEEEYNDEKDYANLVPYGIPMYFYLMNTSDNDWFKILDTPDSKGPYHEVTISVEFTGASSLTQTNEARICKYSLYDSNMQLWGAGSFHFSKSQPVATTTRTVPIGPLYLKVYFDPSYNYGLLPNDSLILRMEAGKDAIQGY